MMKSDPSRRRRLPAAVLAAAAGAMLAAQPVSARTTPFGAFEHDTTQPIEVAADSLEVRNAEQKAVFKGNVRACQGPVVMKADWLEVTYAGRGGAAKKPVAGPLGAGGGAIDRLRARGDVIITNGEEAARSREADYNVAKAAIFLTGDVILLQGDNVIKGQKLRIDLTSGTARMIGDNDDLGSGSRVRLRLDPQQTSPKPSAAPKARGPNVACAVAGR